MTEDSRGGRAQRTLFAGKVVSTEDPNSLGRVQVELQGFSSGVQLPWIRLVQPMASNSYGSMFLPEVDDEVMVFKGAGNDFDAMVVLGSVYNGTNKPKESNDDGENNTKQFVTRSGHELTFVDESGSESITLQTPDAKLSLVMDHAGVEIKIDSDDKITVTSTSKIDVESQEVTVTGSNQVKIDGASKVEITSSAEVSVSAATVSVSGNASISLSAPQVSIG